MVVSLHLQVTSFAFFVLILCLYCSNIVYNVVAMKSEVVDVSDFGAVGDGTADSSKAWNFVCSREIENGVRVIFVPENQTFLLHPVTFNGPCKAKEIKFLIMGRIISPVSPKTWEGLDQAKWLTFYKVSGLKIKGSGEINGRGWGWWNQSCRDHPRLEGCTSLAPTAMIFESCKTSSLSQVRLINSSQTHVLIRGTDGFIVDHVKITAPETSPNTDGIHISSASNIFIRNSIIGTGDDCVSIGDHTTNIHISHVKCGPGHGISIGSLGRSGNFVQVQNIRVNTVTFKGTTNGARIKTWQVGKGYVRGVMFENLFFNSVKNPIIIDQNYCNVRGACKELETGVQIRDVVYRNLWGTSSTEVAITLNCSRSVSCTGLLLQSIMLKSSITGKNVRSSCINAHGAAIGVVQPAPCF
ncbi:hypothetical protein ES319_D06G064100v1 [Gossypium barbadense]|uniref:Pectate lyase superfamily protein domain-containing protein n=1 Tax=Gossypium barbadense TaxID=3634 RepID=A0A5J5QY80_GOSBA|nr:hypothetical protein ES319_D06G064100v1 [Gossypium barbadense]